MLASTSLRKCWTYTTLTHALLLVTTVERQDIRPKTAELYLVPQTKEDQEAKENREVMSLASDVAKRTLQKQESEQWESRRWKPNLRQPVESSEQSKAKLRKP
ncbi:hypothetical protein Tco_0016704 [Tanacetum coccineum]